MLPVCCSLYVRCLVVVVCRFCVLLWIVFRCCALLIWLSLSLVVVGFFVVEVALSAFGGWCCFSLWLFGVCLPIVVIVRCAVMVVCLLFLLLVVSVTSCARCLRFVDLCLLFVAAWLWMLVLFAVV